MKAVIVTGAGSGIGWETARQCVAAGYYVLGCDLDPQRLERLRQEVVYENRGETALLDVSDGAAVDALFARLGGSGPEWHGLINSAGIYLGRNLLDYSDEEIDRVMDVNIKGALYCSRAFARMPCGRETPRRIVNLSSVSGQEGSSDAVYGATKAALLGLTKSCAMSLAPDILVNAVAPGMVETPMMDAIPAWRREEYHRHHLIGGAVSPESVARTILFLLSEGGSCYTGATFDPNHGGYLR